jgi:hypothetical protein
MMTQAELFDRMAAEMRAREDPMTLVLTPPAALALVGLLQLAMRHPDVPVMPARTATMVIEHVRQFFADAPAISEVLKRGDDPAHDHRPFARVQ